MNKRIVAQILSRVLILEAVLLLIPLFTALYYKETFSEYIFTIIIAVAIALMLWFFKPEKHAVYAREGLASVALSWIIISAIGALPFVFSKQLPTFADAFFETVSGFTTTGSSVFKNPEEVNKALLLWRSITQWIGGMGVLVFIMAVTPLVEKSSIHIMRAEVPGPKFGKLAPKMRTSSAISYMIYIALTVILIVLLLAGGMSFFDSINHAFATAATGGFSVKALSIGQYNNLYFEIVLGIFMLLFATNFSFFFLILARKFKNAFKISEVWMFYIIVAVAVITISFDIQSLYGGFFGGLRHAFFQVSSLISTTGFSSTDFALWPSYSRLVLLAVMLIGACASSTGGGLKVIRIMVLVKASLLESLKALSPRSTIKVKVAGEIVDKQSLYLTFVYFFIYMVVTGLATVAVSLNGFDIESSFSAAVTCISNVGPGLAKFGPMENFMALSGLTKIILSMTMLIGRLEIFPIFIIFMPETWRKA